MPATKRGKPIYQRGDFRLFARPGREALEIVWYDSERKRERSASAGTGDHRAARLEVDRLYVKATGQRFCESCGRTFDGDASPLLSQAIADYILLSEERIGYKATKHRLAHVIDYLCEGRAATSCALGGRVSQMATREASASPRRHGAAASEHGRGRRLRAPVLAAINATPGQTASFKAEQT